MTRSRRKPRRKKAARAEAPAAARVPVWKRRRVWVNTSLAAVFVLLAGLLVLLMAHHRPAFYRPVETRDPAKLAAEANAFSNDVQGFVSDLWSGQPFRLELTDDEVNGYLAAANDDALWKRLDLRFTRWRKVFTEDVLHDVQVRFDEGEIRVGGRIEHMGMTFVVHLTGVPRVDNEGRVRLKVRRIRVGSLPIPRFAIARLLRNIDNRPLPTRGENWQITAIHVHKGRIVLEGRRTASPKG